LLLVIRLADINLELAQKVADKIDNPKVKPFKLDASRKADIASAADDGCRRNPGLRQRLPGAGSQPAAFGHPAGGYPLYSGRNKSR
jgi:hypothetical protein